MTAAHLGGAPPNVFDNRALYTVLNAANVPTAPPSATDWYLDTGATSHMSSSPGDCTSNPIPPSSSAITVGNGARMPVTHHVHTSIPTATSNLKPNNILVSPSLINNLISVCQLTCDNNISIEFDPVGFSIKDLRCREEMLRCESPGDLYPLRLPHHEALVASSDVSLWHQRLGHPGHPVLSSILRNF
jgi:hypothetical protein